MTLPPQTPTGRLRPPGAKKTRLAMLEIGEKIVVSVGGRREWGSWRSMASQLGQEMDRRFTTMRVGQKLEIWRIR